MPHHDLMDAVFASVSPLTRQRGRELADEGFVELAVLVDSDRQLRLAALVFDDDGTAPVQTTLTGGASASFHCSCGSLEPCAHLIALGVAYLTESSDDEGESERWPIGIRSLPQERSRSLPVWQRELAQLIAPSAGEEVCVFFDLVQHRRVTKPQLSLRLGMRGARGAWIKGQARWQRVEQLLPEGPALSAVEELRALVLRSAPYTGYYSYGGDEEWARVRDLPSRTLWSLLTDLPGLGVPLIAYPKPQHELVRASEAAEARVEITEARKRLRLTARIAVGDVVFDPASTHLIGIPVVALAAWETGTATLHRLAEPLDEAVAALFTRPSALTIDAAGRDAFEQRYLPALQHRVEVASADSSYAVPAPRVTELVLTIHHDERTAALEWTWDRGPVPPDPLHESALIAAVADACGPHRTLVFSDGAALAALPARMLGGGDAVLFVAEVLPALRKVTRLRVVENQEAPEYIRALTAPNVSMSTAQTDHDWFDLTMQVQVDGEPVPLAELYRALAGDEAVFLLPSGRYFSLDTPELGQLRTIIAEASALADRPVDELRVTRYQVDLVDELAELGIVAAREAEWWLAASSLTTESPEPVWTPESFRATLRDYQLRGLSWLDFLRRHGLGGILADDMGLGKTVQTLAMIDHARGENPRMAPFLIIAPTSMVGVWASECARFAPEIVVRTISETQKRRGIPLADVAKGAHVVVTSYALHRIEDEQYRDLRWSGLILDEAQQVKNHAGHGYRAARDLGAPFTVAITGTPLENNLLELWALISLTCPGLLGGRTHFTEYYRTPIEKGADLDRLAQLKRRIRPFLLRRTKELVASELPSRQDQILELDLHPAHRRLYDRRLHRERQRVLGLLGDVAANRFEIFRSLTLLRQLALDPVLVHEGAAPSAKLEALGGLLREAASEGHRVLVLSQFTRFLRRARETADAAGVSSVYLDGATTGRAAVIDQFRSGEAPVFFLSLKAGGVGLTLVEADYVVLLDPWWNPAVEEQAIARAHRIGQTRPVVVYRFVSRDTIEQKVIALKERKSGLFSRVLDDDAGFVGTGLTADDIRALLD